jgi:pimeloyl-ACP methyl ester carboxylesterase
MTRSTRARAVRPSDWALPPRPVRRELLSRLPETPSDLPPLLFVPGLGQGAWCFDEHWLPHAAGRGFSAYAVSLRGHGASEGGDRIKRWKLRDYVHDVVQAAVSLPEQPVIVGHSLGALVVQKAVERYPARAVVLVTPVGTQPVARSLAQVARQHPTDVLRTFVGGTLPLRAEYLFTGLDPATAAGYVARNGEESALVQFSMLLHRPPAPPLGGAPVMVLGAASDQLIARPEVEATARHYGVRPVMVDGVGHHMPLDAGWQEPLDTILDWVEKEVPR